MSIETTATSTGFEYNSNTPLKRTIGNVGLQDLELMWQERAMCAQTDPEAFFPEKGGSPRQAKKVCLSCDVREECLKYALDHDERFGVWGGLSERERRKLIPHYPQDDLDTV